MSISIQQVSKNFGSFQALGNINLTIPDGKLVALLGPSGSGKSTLLRTIAGLEKPDMGRIIINGQDTTNLDIRRRNIGFVFQHYALFKHLTVRQNIAFGLDIRKHPAKQIKNKVEELLGLIQLQGLGDRYPSQLSGGQRQRVALARALAVEPQVLLLDEPFGALDAKVRKELRSWLRRLHDEVHITSVFVTHDQEEAMEVADEIVVMNHGKIEQVGSPQEVYDHPATSFVMEFVGEVNILPGTVGLLDASAKHDTILPNVHPSQTQVFIRPHDLEIHCESDAQNKPAIVKRIIHLGWEILVELELPDGREILANISREKFAHLPVELGQVVYIKPRHARYFVDPKSNAYTSEPLTVNG
ncbi:sulfate ABC transporter ATP-binding protein [Aphanothece hegewaldii CCALA 016]|uniref:Sulfate ABC transporter ATP-binding protein n=1 Tax=Aphanothece hegewaldii CCALA 016 TaxID=2107694 RepID=A0A2T1LU67_9CHRO|nr:sulfate/molybdate ABC transporter ATP-binding protein [Aphanothece hegewaldii]PSF34989.1 sulfate ABC transporter ATP-binding protein [Aphanothece hegewaldii CCALA 016]